MLHHAALGHLPDLVREQALLAAGQAVAAGAHRQAAAHLELLLSFRDQLPADTVAAALTDRAHSLYLLNRFAESQRLAVESVAMWESIGDPAQLGRALVGLARTGLWAVGPRFAEQAAQRAVTAAEQARSRTAPTRTPPRCCSPRRTPSSPGPAATWRPSARSPSPDRARSSTPGVAVELARQTGRDDLVAHTLTYLGAERLSNGDPAGRDELDEAVRIAARDPRVEYVTRGCVNASGAAYRSGEPELALDYVRTGLAGCADGEFFAGEYRLDLTRAAIKLSTGDWDEAEAGLRDLVDRPGEPGLMRPMATACSPGCWPGAAGTQAGLAARPRGRRRHRLGRAALVGPVAAAAAELHWLGGTGRPARLRAGRLRPRAAAPTTWSPRPSWRRTPPDAAVPLPAADAEPGRAGAPRAVAAGARRGPPAGRRRVAGAARALRAGRRDLGAPATDRRPPRCSPTSARRPR